MLFLLHDWSAVRRVGIRHTLPLSDLPGDLKIVGYLQKVPHTDRRDKVLAPPGAGYVGQDPIRRSVPRGFSDVC